MTTSAEGYELTIPHPNLRPESFLWKKDGLSVELSKASGGKASFRAILHRDPYHGRAEDLGFSSGLGPLYFYPEQSPGTGRVESWRDNQRPETVVVYSDEALREFQKILEGVRGKEDLPRYSDYLYGLYRNWENYYPTKFGLELDVYEGEWDERSPQTSTTEVHSDAVIIDGSNIARNLAEGEVGRLEYLKMAMEEAKKRWSEVHVIIDASLPHHIDDPDGLAKMVKEGAVRMAPPKTEADEFILPEAERVGATVMTATEKFEDRAERYPWVKDRGRVVHAFLNLDGKGIALSESAKGVARLIRHDPAPAREDRLKDFPIRGEVVLSGFKKSYKREFPEGEMFAVQYYVDAESVREEGIYVNRRGVEGLPHTYEKRFTFEFGAKTDIAILLMMWHSWPKVDGSIREAVWVTKGRFAKDEQVKKVIMETASTFGYSEAVLTNLVSSPGRPA